MNKLLKKFFVTITSLIFLFILTSCKSGGSEEKTEIKEDVIDTVYIKRGDYIADERSEYIEIKYDELNNFSKLYSGIFVIFKLKSDVYIDTITFHQEGGTDTNFTYQAGTNNSLTSYTGYVDYETKGTIDLKSDNEIIIDNKYENNKYFYFSISSYCQYSNIKINYSKEKQDIDDALGKYVRIGYQNYKLSELTNGKEIEGAYSILIPINKEIKIKNIHLSLKLSTKSSSLSMDNYVNKIDATNVDEWYSEYTNLNSNHDLNYTIEHNATFGTFLSNVKSTSKGSIESLDYLNTYKDNIFSSNVFNFESSKQYEINNLNLNAKKGDYLIINISNDLSVLASYKSGYDTTHDNSYFTWYVKVDNISNLQIDYE